MLKKFLLALYALILIFAPGALANITKPEHEIIILYTNDIAVPGNHEFDYDMPRFFNFAKNLNCGYISCNFRNADNNLIFKPYKILIIIILKSHLSAFALRQALQPQRRLFS